MGKTVEKLYNIKNINVRVTVSSSQIDETWNLLSRFR